MGPTKVIRGSVVRRAAASFLLLGVAACATKGGITIPGAGPGRAWVLTDSVGGAEVDQLGETFYGTDFDPGAIEGQTAKVLAQYPHSARAHEVAAYLALLRGDDHAAGVAFKEAAADRHASLTPLYLWEASFLDVTVSDTWDTVALLRAIAAGHADPGARAAASGRLAALLKRLGRGDEADTIRGSLGHVDKWALAAAFDNDQGKGFLTNYPPEAAIDLAAEMPGVVVPAHWRPVPALQDGVVPVGHLVWPRDYSAAYLLTFVRSDKDQKAIMRLTTDAPMRIWWNDALMLSEARLEAGDGDNLAVPVTLHQGWNKLLIKSGNRGSRRWVVGARFTDAAGAVLPGLAFGNQPEATKKDPEGRAPEGDGAWIPADVAQLPPARRRFLTARLLQRAGLARKRLATLQEMQAVTPKNPVVKYHTALALWDNEETGKALDLLNEGAAQSGLPAFRSKRARFFVQKQQWEKAQADLQAVVAVAPDAYQARLDLADVYARRRWLIERCQTLESVVQRWPDGPGGLRELAWCLEEEGYVDRSGPLLQRAATLEPGNGGVAQSIAAQALRRWDYPAALEANARARALDPQDGDLLIGEGELQRKMGHPAQARHLFEAATKLSPDWPRPYQLLGDLAAWQGDAAEAVRLRKLALLRDPNNTQLAEHVGSLEPAHLGLMERYVPSDATIEAATGSAGTVPVAPGSQVVLLLDHEVTLVAADGSAKQVITTVSQAKNVQGRDTLTQAYLAGRGDARILRAYSIGPKGERSEASSISGSVVRFRNLDVGSIVVLQYIANQNPRPYLPNHYSGSWYFQGLDRQVEQVAWVLATPKGRKLNVEVHGDVRTVTKVDGDYDVRTFSAEHVPPVVPEIMMSPAGDILRRVSVSSVPGWDEFARWERALLTDAFRSNDKLQALVRKLTDGATTPAEKRDRLFHFVAHEVRYQQEYEDSIAGVRPHAAPVVLERGYGDCKDKAVLLIQLAKLADLKLQFALLRTPNLGALQKDLPFQQFNHAIVYVPAQAGLAEQFLDPTADDLDIANLPVSDQGTWSLVIDPDTGAHQFREIPFYTPERELIRHHIQVQVNAPDAAVATDDVTMRGHAGATFRRLLRNDEAAQKSFQQMVSALFAASTLRSGTAENQEDIWKPLLLKLTLDATGAIQPLDEQWRMVLPGAFSLGEIVGLAERHTPLRLGPPQQIVFDVEMQLPAGFEAKHLPASIEVHHRCFDLRRSAHSDGRKVQVMFDYVRRCTDVAPADYADLRVAAQKAQKLAQDQIVFGKLGPARRAGRPHPRQR